MRFRLTSAGSGQALKVSAPARGFVGYRVLAKVSSAGFPSGTTVQVQARRGGVWRTAGSESIVSNGATVPVLLSKRDDHLRAVVVSGTEQVVSGERAISVVAAAKWLSAAVWRGSWRGSKATGSSAKNVSWVVPAGGRTLRSAKFRVTATCPTAASPSQFTIQILTVTLASVPVAPDGTFVAARTVKGHAILLSGRMKGRTATGRVRVSLGSCVGSLTIAARRT